MRSYCDNDMAFLKDRWCAKCGSTMVAWRYREPHCFCCGSNLPFSDPDHVPSNTSAEERVLEQEKIEHLEYEDCLKQEGMASIVSFDPIIEIARSLLKKRRSK